MVKLRGVHVVEHNNQQRGRRRSYRSPPHVSEICEQQNGNGSHGIAVVTLTEDKLQHLLEKVVTDKDTRKYRLPIVMQ